MGRVTLDGALSTELGASSLPIELCDVAGKSIGFFVPTKAFYASLESPSTKEELERRLQSGGGRTWPEIRADLEKKYGPA
jgi:hypothetical protein